MAAKPETLFIRACSTGKSETVRQLIQSGLSPNTQDNYGLTGLIWAGRNGQIEVARVLVESGAELDWKDRTGRTALSHAVAFKRHAFVQFMASNGAFLNPADMHGWTPLDLASVPKDARMVEILKKFGAQRKITQEPPSEDETHLNTFYGGAGGGGPDLPIEVERIHIQLSATMRRWKGNYTDAIKTFGFVLFVDGSLIRYTETMNILGTQKAKRKRDWVEVRVGVPESWWREKEPAYKKRLVDSIEEGLHSTIALLRRNRHNVNAKLLLADWATVKTEFLDAPAPAFPAERQRAAMRSMVDDAIRAVEGKRSKARSC
jgi:hypothetical protein